MRSLEETIEVIDLRNMEERKTAKTIDQKKDLLHKTDIIDEQTKTHYLSIINKLNANPKLMIDRNGKEVVKRPAPNQKCPCGLNKSYKKCSCA